MINSEGCAKRRIAVVIPCFKVRRHIQGVLERIGPEVDQIYCVDDACPEASGDFIEALRLGPRVNVIRHERNQGVGGAVLTGYARAAAEGATVIVKIDGDGQMDPQLLPSFVAPILAGEADYTKGNRFFDLTNLGRMPGVRIVGNGVLSLLTKLSTGYWDIFDPTNGYTAIHADVARLMPATKISRRYFFETDMLFRLGTLRAVVADIPMDPCYGDEQSGLSVKKVVFEFAAKHIRNFFKRLLYSYVLRDMPLASIQLAVGIMLLVFGSLFGAWHWWISASTGVGASVGTVMISTMAILVALQLILAFLAYDISNTPRQPLHRRLIKSVVGRVEQ